MSYRPDTLPQFVKTEAIEVVFCSKLCAGGEVAEYRGLSGALFTALAGNRRGQRTDILGARFHTAPR
jgi:hypothetical protein